MNSNDCQIYHISYPIDSVEEDMGLNNKQEGLSRMLSLAIIPGRHISSIAVAKGKSPNEPLIDPSSLKHQNQRETQHENQHEDQHENHDQHEHEGQHKNHEQIQDESQHTNQDQNEHTDQNMSQHDQHKDDIKNEHSKEHESEGIKNTTDACTEEHGQTEDFHTPQKHLTLQ